MPSANHINRLTELACKEYLKSLPLETISTDNIVAGFDSEEYPSPRAVCCCNNATPNGPADDAVWECDVEIEVISNGDDQQFESEQDAHHSRSGEVFAQFFRGRYETIDFITNAAQAAGINWTCQDILPAGQTREVQNRQFRSKLLLKIICYGFALAAIVLPVEDVVAAPSGLAESEIAAVAPTSISGLYAWYNPLTLGDDGDNPNVFNGDEIGLWSDSSGNGRALIKGNTEASGPLMVEQGLGSVPCYGICVEFDASIRRLATSSSGAFGSGLTALEYIIVAQAKQPEPAQDAHTSLMGLTTLYPLTAPSLRGEADGGLSDATGSQSIADVVLDQNDLYDTWRMYGGSLGATRSLYLEHTKIYGPSANVFSLDQGELRLGRIPDGLGGFKYLRGYVQEIIIFSRQLGNFERRGLWAWMKARYPLSAGILPAIVPGNQLSWTNGETYTSIEVWRAAAGQDAELLDTISGSATSYFDEDMGSEPFTYTVRGNTATGASAFSNALVVS